jgi:bifunctional non-homologous end joining protein LigD
MATKPTERVTSLAGYRAKRDFAVTAEPAPAQTTASSNAPMFVIQKHAAHRAGLHWDLRLEHGGVLWSWAVREGPSLDPADRRIAVHVEDHPIDYADFQGTIPAGQYGGGTVETWDRGTWTALEDPDKGMKTGSLRFELSGQRLHGRFTLARLRRDPKKQEAWYLIKGHDEYAREGVHALDIQREKPLQTKKVNQTKLAIAKRSKLDAPAEGAVRRAMPEAQAPQLCSLAEDPPDGALWLSEIEFDGYRIVAAIEDGKVRLLTRNGHDWADRMPSIAANFKTLPIKSAMLDGELVSLGADGVSSFPGLQAALKTGRDDTLTFYAFDLLHLDGWDLRGCELLERKRVLAGLAEWTGALRYGRQPLSCGSGWRLAQGQMLRQGGVRRVGVDRAGRQPHPDRSAAGRIPRPDRRLAIRRSRRHGLRSQRTPGIA